MASILKHAGARIRLMLSAGMIKVHSKVDFKFTITAWQP